MSVHIRRRAWTAESKLRVETPSRNSDSKFRVALRPPSRSAVRGATRRRFGRAVPAAVDLEPSAAAQALSPPRPALPCTRRAGAARTWGRRRLTVPRGRLMVRGHRRGRIVPGRCRARDGCRSESRNSESADGGLINPARKRARLFPCREDAVQAKQGESFSSWGSYLPQLRRTVLSLRRCAGPANTREPFSRWAAGDPIFG